jgi:oligosaccharide 4-alpha-D-glucosyltransferase
MFSKPLLSFILLLAARLTQAQTGTPLPDSLSLAAPQDDTGLPPHSARILRNYTGHQWSNGLLTVNTSDGATLTLQLYAPTALRVAFYPVGTPAVAATSFAVTASPAGSATLSDTPTRLTLTAAGLAVEIQKNPVRLLYRRGGDTLLLETPGYFEAGSTRGLRFGLRAGEALYGTGSRALPVDRRGQRVPLYNQASYGYQNGESRLNISIPLVLSSRGYGLLFDEPRPGYLDLGLTDATTLEYGTEADRLTYFVLADSTLPALLRTYTALSGRQPLPPRWALGYLQSKYGYQTETEARSIVQSLRSQGFPLAGLVLDLYWFGGPSRMGNLDWDRRSFPNPVRMLHDFDSVGVKTILINEPYLTQASSNYGPASAASLLARTSTGAPYVIGNFWAGPAALLDLTNPAARTWLWPFYRARAQEGVAGWWSDLGEPRCSTLAGRPARFTTYLPTSGRRCCRTTTGWNSPRNGCSTSPARASPACSGWAPCRGVATCSVPGAGCRPRCP